MADYPIPPWLTPQAAQGWGALAGEAARSRLQATLEQDRMAQQSAQFAIESQQRSQQAAQENQMRQDALNYDHLVEQQKIAIDNAYKQQQLGLQKQDEELAQQQFQMKATDAARKYAATASFQKAILPKDQGGEGLSPTEAALKYMAPAMTGTEIGRLAAIPQNFKPGATFAIPDASSEGLVQVAPNRWEKYATIPKTITNTPTATAVKDDDGKVIGHYVQLPGEKPHYQPATQTKTSPMEELRQREAQKNQGKDAKAAPKAQGGYKIGVVYKGGLKYLGGDPNSESSWEKVNQ